MQFYSIISKSTDTTVFESALDMDDVSASSIVEGGVPLTIDATSSSPKVEESGEMTSSIPSTPSSPRQEPVGMNNEEEHFSVSFEIFLFLFCFYYS